MRRTLMNITGRTEIRMNTAIAEPSVKLPKLNETSYMSLASTFVPKLPPVETFTMSNTLVTSTIRVVVTTPTVGRI